MRFLHRETHRKLSPNFDGPWEVTKRLDPPDQIGNAYVLKRDEEVIIRPLVDLKPFRPQVFQETKKNESDINTCLHANDCWRFLFRRRAAFSFTNCHSTPIQSISNPNTLTNCHST